MSYQALVIGTGSQHTQQLYELSNRYLQQQALEFSIVLESDVQTIATYDIDITPALLINGVVVYAKPGQPEQDLLHQKIDQFIRKHPAS
jgi:Thioredoxin domain